MAKSDVKLTVSGLDGVTPIGVSVNYSLGAIPTATVDLAPQSPGIIKIVSGASGVLGDVDKAKRKQDIVIDITTKSYISGKAGKDEQSLKFIGLLDGLSVGNVVGANSYQAVIKNKAQTLLELTTVSPGLYPTSVNIYRNASMSMTTNSQQEENQSVIAWANIKATNKLPYKESPIKFYTELMKLIIKIQTDEWYKFTGMEKLTSGLKAFQRVFTDKRYKAALARAKTFFENIDLSAVQGGTHVAIKTGNAIVMQAIQLAFQDGPNVLLENYINFLNQMGCSLVFGNSKAWVVPINSVIKYNYKEPGKRQNQTEPNQGCPADYNSFNYNDNGYRDISSVVVTTPLFKGSFDLGKFKFEHGVIGEYVDKEDLTQASGVLVVSAHPFMTLSHTAAYATDARDGKQRMDSKQDSMYTSSQKFSEAVTETKTANAERLIQKEVSYSDFIQSNLDNYAEIKFYQARYGDRQGSITMDFNPNWVPGTGGYLYIRNMGMFLAFYVNSVTHRVDMSPPNNGTAITIVNFNCGRMGKSPAGVAEDLFFGYNLGKENAIQTAFLADNK